MNKFLLRFKTSKLKLDEIKNLIAINEENYVSGTYCTDDGVFYERLLTAMKDFKILVDNDVGCTVQYITVDKKQTNKK